MLCHLPRAVLPSCPHDLNPFYACEITPTLGSFSEGLGLQTFSKSITNAWVVFKGEALRKICNTLSGRRQQFWQGHPMQCTSMSFLMFLVLVEALATVGSDKEWAKRHQQREHLHQLCGGFLLQAIFGANHGKPAEVGPQSDYNLAASRHRGIYASMQAVHFTFHEDGHLAQGNPSLRWKRTSCLDIGHLHL